MLRPSEYAVSSSGPKTYADADADAGPDLRVAHAVALFHILLKFVASGIFQGFIQAKFLHILLHAKMTLMTSWPPWN